jgi:hypothetical protein
VIYNYWLKFLMIQSTNKYLLTFIILYSTINRTRIHNNIFSTSLYTNLLTLQISCSTIYVTIVLSARASVGVNGHVPRAPRFWFPVIHSAPTWMKPKKKKNLPKTYSQHIIQNTQVSQEILLNFYQIIFVRYVENKMFVKTKMFNVFIFIIGLLHIRILCSH